MSRSEPSASELESVTIAERRETLTWRHKLAPSAKSDNIDDIADALVGLHSSDPASVYLSCFARMTNPSFQSVGSALYDVPTLIRHHAMRRTLWVLSAKNAKLCHVAATDRIAVAERKRTIRLFEEQAGIGDGEAWLAGAESEVLQVLRELGVASTRQIAQALPHLRIQFEIAPGKKYSAAGSTLSRVLLMLGFEGRIARTSPAGGWNNSQYSWALMTDFLPEGIDGGNTDQARAELARCWLAAFGPAPASDLQWWTGWPMGVTKRALANSQAVEVLVEVSEGHFVGGWKNSASDIGESLPGYEPWTAFLPALDPTTMGWKMRDWYLDPKHVPMLFDRNGNAGPTVWIDAKIVGGWNQTTSGAVVYRLLGDVPKSRVHEIDDAALALEALLGDRRFKVRFPVPMQRELLA